MTKSGMIAIAEAGQPINYTGGRGGYDDGKKMAATKGDYIKDAAAMRQVRTRIFKAAKAANLFCLNSCNEQNVDMLKEGVMICTGGDTPAAEKGRQFTKRQGVW
jgi:hypothetical protein